MTIISPAFALKSIIPGGGFRTIDLLTVAPMVPAKPLTTGLPTSAQTFAQWDFGPDNGSLSSVSSGHTIIPLAAAGLTYDDTSVANAAVAFAGATVPIVDTLAGPSGLGNTWWGVNKITGAVADGGIIFGNYADDNIDTTAGFEIFRNNGSAGAIGVQGRGTISGANILAGNLLTAGDNVFWCLSMDSGGGIEVLVGPATANVVLGRAKGVFTFSGVGTNGSLLTIGMHTVTVGTDFAIGSSAAASANNFFNYVNINKGPLGGVYAVISGAVVTVYYSLGGTVGNSLAQASNDAAITVPGAMFTGGASRIPSSRLPAMFNAYSSAALNMHSQKSLELGYAPTTFSPQNLPALYAEVKSRLGQQGVTVK